MNRLATPGDVPDIMKALMKMLSYSPAPQMKYACPIEAELSVRHAIHEGRAVLFNGYFIMFDLGRDWYARQGVTYLIEQIILKVEKTDTPVEEAIAHLVTLAKERGASLVAAGDTQVGYMGPKYLGAGFLYLGKQYIKELP